MRVREEFLFFTNSRYKMLNLKADQQISVPNGQLLQNQVLLEHGGF